MNSLNRGAGWAQAKRVFRGILELMGCPDPDERIGYVRFLHEGLTYKVYWTVVQLPGLWKDTEKAVVIRLPQQDAPDDQRESARREMRLLPHLANLDLPVEIPRLIGGMSMSSGIALVQEKIFGIPVELWVKHGRVRPWEPVARAASVCHCIDPSSVQHILPYYKTRRAHALACLRIFDDLDLSETTEATAWARDHLPVEAPSCLVHGDLLEQNLLFDLERESLGLLDWGEALMDGNDPACDLAIVTRGRRKAFKLRDGMAKLLEAYNAHASIGVNACDVHLYELCLLAGFYKQAVLESGKESPYAEAQRDILRNFVRRLVQNP